MFKAKQQQSFSCIQMTVVSQEFFEYFKYTKTIRKKLNLIQISNFILRLFSTSMQKFANRLWTDIVKLGQYELKNRIVMAALTRTRCDPANSIPNDLMRNYYAQRTGAGLILTQASAWDKRGEAFPGAGNIFNKQQAEGWKKIIGDAHEKNTRIFIQMFHGGRVATQQTNGGMQVWGPSPIAINPPPNEPSLGFPGEKPKQMTQNEIRQVQDEFRRGVMLAKEAGFDGIQLHGAHGYLIDQFLRTSSNQRKDEYGGSIENRCRFCLELVNIALEYYQPWQIGIKISPVCQYGDMYDEDPVALYSHLLQELSKKNIGFAQIKESTEYNPSVKYKFPKNPVQQIEKVCHSLRPYFNGLIIGNESFNGTSGLQIIRSGDADLISFGRFYVGNPDCAERIINGWPLNQDMKWNLLYGNGLFNVAEGYSDYPFYSQTKK